MQIYQLPDVTNSALTEAERKNQNRLPIWHSPSQSTRSIESSITGGVYGAWSKVYESEISGVSNLVIPNLNGNLHKVYRIIFGLSMNVTFGSSSFLKLRPNGDSAINYRSTITFNEGDAVRNYSSVVNSLQLASTCRARNTILVGESVLYATSGRARIATGTYAGFAADGTALQANNMAASWNNVTDNISHFVLNFDGASDCSGSLVIFALKG